MERFRWAARLVFKTSAPCRNVAPVPCLMNNLWSEENEIVNECSNQRCAIRVWSQKKPEHQKRGVNPRQPFDLYGQNKKDVNDFVGIKARECEEQRRDEHAIGEIAAEKKCRDSRANHPYHEIKRQSEGPPGAFETFADEPEKPEREKHPQWTERLRKEDIGDEPPNLASKNQSRIER